MKYLNDSSTDTELLFSKVNNNNSTLNCRLYRNKNSFITKHLALTVPCICVTNSLVACLGTRKAVHRQLMITRVDAIESRPRAVVPTQELDAWQCWQIITVRRSCTTTHCGRNTTFASTGRGFDLCTPTSTNLCGRKHVVYHLVLDVFYIIYFIFYLFNSIN